MPIDLYFSEFSPPCRAVLATAQVLGLEVEQKKLNMKEGEHRKPEFLKLNPAHTIPTLVDDGFPVFESRAILTYLVDKYSPDHYLYPKDLKKRTLVDTYLYYDAATLSHAVGGLLRPKFYKKEDPPQEAYDHFKEKLATFEDLLGDKKFLGGDKPTLADLSIAALLPSVKLLDKSLLTPKTAEYVKRTEEAVPQLKKLNAVLDGPLPF